MFKLYNMFKNLSEYYYNFSRHATLEIVVNKWHQNMLTEHTSPAHKIQERVFKTRAAKPKRSLHIQSIVPMTCLFSQQFGTT
jgi:hypothetical protein